jgi:RAMP superfamily
VRLTIHHFVGYALTPVHIGDGTTMTPDGYRLQSSSSAILERFDPPAVIAAMSPTLRAEYIRALSQGGVKQAQEILRKAADGAIWERLSISQYSRYEIEQVITNPLRRGRISPFVRSGGTPILPGSSVKGAVRTAWLAREARSIARDEVRDLSTSIRRAGPGKTGRESEKIHHTAFESEQNHTEQDPLRDISVSDAPLEVDGTVIDRVHVANCTKDGPIAIDGQAGMQIHVERLASIADAGEFSAKPFKIAIAAPDGTALHERREGAGPRAEGGGNIPRAIPRRSPNLDELRRATNAHHTAIWFYERRRFYLGTRTDRLMDELLLAFGFPEVQEKLEPALDANGAWLLKLGRYGHFESKSIEVEGRRYGDRAPRQGRPAEFMTEGGSRTVARDSVGRFLPFGWVMLFPEANAPKPAPHLVPPSKLEQRTFGREVPAAVRALAAGQYRFRKGDRVTDGVEQATVEHDVRSADATMSVSFDNGDIEPVSVDEWTKT